jgi:hypothetical protein
VEEQHSTRQVNVESALQVAPVEADTRMMIACAAMDKTEAKDMVVDFAPRSAQQPCAELSAARPLVRDHALWKKLPPPARLLLSFMRLACEPIPFKRDTNRRVCVGTHNC